jgi:hypothetical protein
MPYSNQFPKWFQFFDFDILLLLHPIFQFLIPEDD